MRRAELGIDGNCGFALLGEDIQSGEAEFVEIVPIRDELPSYWEIVAAKRAFRKLQERISDPISYYFGDSHPYGSG